MFTGQAVISLVLGPMFARSAEVSATDLKFYARSEFGFYQYDTTQTMSVVSPKVLSGYAKN